MSQWAKALPPVIHNLPMGIAVFDTDSVLRECNPVWVELVCALTAAPPDAIQPGQSLRALLAGHSAEIAPDFAAALAGETILHKPISFGSAEIVTWDSTLAPLIDERGVVGLLWTISDISARKRAEAEARTAKRALVTLMDSLPGMAYRGTLAPSRPMDLVSQGAADLTGYPRERFLAPANPPYGDLIHPEDRDETWQTLASAVGDQQPFELLYRIRTADDQIKWVLEQGNQLQTDSDGPIILEGFISDVTERVLAQQILERRIIDRTRKLSALYEMMAASAEQGDLSTNLHNALRWVLTAVHGQQALLHLHNRTQGCLQLMANVGISAEEEAQLATISDARVPWKRVVATGRATSCAACLIADNTHTFAGFPLWAHNQFMGVLSIWRDSERPFSEGDMALMASAADQMATTIDTARLRRNSDRLLLLDERNRLARELHDAVTQSLYSLTLFAAANRRAAGESDLDKVCHYSDRIATTAEQTLKEMRLLLHNLRPSLLQDSGLVAALRKRLDSVEKRSGVQARLDAPDALNLPPHVEETLFHIAEEALNNALKHASAEMVIVTLQQSGSVVCLSISDDGCGFEPALETESGGLGLTSMRERIETLGGTLTIDSAPGQTTITTRVDLAQLEQATASQTMLDLLEAYQHG